MGPSAPIVHYQSPGKLLSKPSGLLDPTLKCESGQHQYLGKIVEPDVDFSPPGQVSQDILSIYLFTNSTRDRPNAGSLLINSNYQQFINHKYTIAG